MPPPGSGAAEGGGDRGLQEIAWNGGIVPQSVSLAWDRIKVSGSENRKIGKKGKIREKAIFKASQPASFIRSSWKGTLCGRNHSFHTAVKNSPSPEIRFQAAIAPIICPMSARKAANYR